MIIRNAKPLQRIYVQATDSDILCGRGMQNFKHPGNQSLRTKIFLKLDMYLDCERKRDKTSVIRSVIDEVLNEGGRFLKCDHSAALWYNGGHAAAKIRVGVGFRDAKSPNKVRYKEYMRASTSCSADSDSDQVFSPHPEAKEIFPSRPTHSSSLFDLVVIPTIANARPRSSSSFSKHSNENEELRQHRTRPNMFDTSPNLDGCSSEIAIGDFQINSRIRRDDVSDTVTAKYLLQALSGGTDETSNLRLNEKEGGGPHFEEKLEEIDHNVVVESSMSSWEAYTGERLVMKGRRPSSSDDALSNDESLFSDETLNEIFGSVNPTTDPWEPIIYNR